MNKLAYPKDIFPYIFILFYFTFNFIFISECLSITHDSIYYLDALIDRPFELFPHHLLFIPVTSQLSNFFILIGIKSKLVAASLVNSLAGSIILILIYKIVRNNFKFEVRSSRITISLCAFSFGFWFYNLNIETYLLPLVFVLGSIYLLTLNDFSLSKIILAAILGGISVLFHQQHGLFGLAVVFFLLFDGYKKNLKKILVFAFVFNLTWLFGYIIAIILLGFKSLDEIFHWFFLYHYTMNAWSQFGLSFFIAPIIGIIRSVISIQGVFINDALSQKIFQLFRDNNLADDAYLVRNLNEVYLFIYIFLIAVIFSLLSVVVIKNIKSLPILHLKNKRIILLYLLLAVYSAFFIFWVPSNLEFWIPQSLFFGVILGYLINNKITDRRIYFQATIVVILLFILNFRFTILLTSDRDNDYYYSEVIGAKNKLPANSMIIYDNEWLVSKYYKLYAPELSFISYYDALGIKQINDLNEFINKSIKVHNYIAIKESLIDESMLKKFEYNYNIHKVKIGDNSFYTIGHY